MAESRRSSTPLAGRRLALTRPRAQNAEWRARLEALGASVLELPLIQVTKHYDKQTLVEVFAELSRYEWIVFTSANGARFFFEEFHRAFDDVRAIGLAQIAVVGGATAAVVRAEHLRVEVQPQKANAGELARALTARESLDSAKVLVVTGNLNRDTLVDALNEARAIVDCLPLYRTEEADVTGDPVAADYRRHGAAAVFFASPSAVQAYVDQARVLAPGTQAERPLLGSIGPTTSAALRQLGLPVDFEAATPSLDGLVAALLPKLQE